MAAAIKNASVLAEIVARLATADTDISGILFDAPEAAERLGDVGDDIKKLLVVANSLANEYAALKREGEAMALKLKQGLTEPSAYAVVFEGVGGEYKELYDRLMALQKKLYLTAQTHNLVVSMVQIDLTAQFAPTDRGSGSLIGARDGVFWITQRRRKPRYQVIGGDQLPPEVASALADFLGIDPADLSGSAGPSHHYGERDYAGTA